MNATTSLESIMLAGLTLAGLLAVIALDILARRFRKKNKIARNERLLNRRDNFPVGDMQEQEEPQ